MFRTEGRVAPDPGLSLKPGARLVREWHGRTHTVTVTEDGFEYAGTTLSVAHENRQKDHRCPLVGPSLLRSCAGGSHRTRATETTMAKSPKAVGAAYQKAAMRGLHAQIVRGRPGASLQFARCPARSLRRLCSISEARRLGGLADVVRRWRLSGGTLDRPALQRLLPIFAPARLTSWSSIRSTGSRVRCSTSPRSWRPQTLAAFPLCR